MSKRQGWTKWSQRGWDHFVHANQPNMHATGSDMIRLPWLPRWVTHQLALAQALDIPITPDVRAWMTAITRIMQACRITLEHACALEVTIMETAREGERTFGFTAHEVTLITELVRRASGAPSHPDQIQKDVENLLYFCEKRHLNPLMGDIYPMYMKGKLTKVVSIQAKVTLANAHPSGFALADPPAFEYYNNRTTPQGLIIPDAVTVSIWKTVGNQPVKCCWRIECAEFYRPDKETHRAMPHVMMAKCALSRAIDYNYGLTGMYIPEEMGTIDAIDDTPDQVVMDVMRQIEQVHQTDAKAQPGPVVTERVLRIHSDPPWTTFRGKVETRNELANDLLDRLARVFETHDGSDPATEMAWIGPETARTLAVRMNQWLDPNEPLEALNAFVSWLFYERMCIVEEDDTYQYVVPTVYIKALSAWSVEGHNTADFTAKSTAIQAIFTAWKSAIEATLAPPRIPLYGFPRIMLADLDMRAENNPNDTSFKQYLNDNESRVFEFFEDTMKKRNLWRGNRAATFAQFKTTQEIIDLLWSEWAAWETAEPQAA